MVLLCPKNSILGGIMELSITDSKIYAAEKRNIHSLQRKYLSIYRYNKTCIIKNILILLAILSLLNCTKNLERDASIVFSISKKLENKETVCDSDFLYQGIDLKNIFFPNILYNNLTLMSNRDDILNFITELRSILVKDSVDLFDIYSYNMIFNIAKNHIQYAQNDTIQTKKIVGIFGHSILEELAKLIAYNVNKGNLSNDSEELSYLYGELERLGHIIPFSSTSKIGKLWKNIKYGNWKYIFKRIGSEAKGVLNS